MSKSATIFDHLGNITKYKKDWNELSELDQKSFVPYLINRWLSMSYDLIELVDLVQRHTIGGSLDRKHVYQLYYDILPKFSLYVKYIKRKTEDDYNDNLIELLCRHFSISSKQAEEYIDIISAKPNANDIWIELLSRYGIPENEYKKYIIIKGKKK